MVMQAIRDRAQNWIAWVIVSFLIIVFAVWGINVYFEPESNVTVATVNGEKISYAQFQNAYDFQRQRLAQQFGPNFDPRLMEALGMKQQVLQRLVEEEVQLQHTTKEGYRVGDMQLASYINQIQLFQKEGKFDRELYEQVLNSNSRTPSQWEWEQRRALQLQQPAKGVVETAFTVKPEIDYFLKLRDQKRTVGYSLLPLSQYASQVTADDAEVKKYYDDHKKDFMTPEEVKVDYIELSVDNLAKDIKVDEAELPNLYEKNKSNYGTEERRRASHILVQVDSGADAAKEDAARKKAEGILEQLKGGANFEELAKKESDDPGSAKQGGDLGFFGRGVMDKAFEDATFALDKGQLSGVVRSGFGFHIIKLVDIEPAKIKPFEEVKSALQQEYRQHQAEERYFQLVERLETLAFEHPDSLAAASEELALPIQSTEFFSRESGGGIAADPKFRGAAFEPDVQTEGNNSGVIELGNNRIAVLHKKERKDAAPKTLEQVKEQIVTAIKNEKAKELVKKDAAAFLEALQKGGDPTEQAKTYKSEWKRPAALGRDDPSLDHELVAKVFSSARPAEGKPVYAETVLSNGDHAIFALYEVQDGDPVQVKEEDRKIVEDGQSRQIGEAAYNSLVEVWKTNAKIVTYSEKLQ